jgi:hypothetical protein
LVLGKGVSSFGGVPEEAGTFHVEIIGRRGKAEGGDKTPVYTMTLVVAGGDPPTIARQPTGRAFDMASDVKLEVAAEGGGVHYRWSKNGEEIATSVRMVVNEGTTRRVMVPSGAVMDLWKTDVAFDDSAWRSGTGGVGYERSSKNTYDDFFALDIEAEAYRKNGSALIRIP